MLESAATLVQEYADLEAQLAEPAVHSDQNLVRKLNKRYAALAPTGSRRRTERASAISGNWL